MKLKQLLNDEKSCSIKNLCKWHKGKAIPYNIEEGPGDRDTVFKCEKCGAYYTEYFK